MDHRTQSGFTLAALIFFFTALSILIAVTVPSYQMQAKRVQEEELIFRGEEYSRAILKFQRKFGAWPPSIDALVETNGIRFLRKPYTDPISGKPFRLITINADGTVNGSIMFKANNPFAPQGSTNRQNPQSGQQPGQQPGQNNQSRQQQPGTGFQQQPPNQNPQQTQQSQPGFPSQPNSGGSLNQPGGPNSSPTAAGIGIIGVASESDKDSIKVYNTRQKYNEWEFLAVLNQANPNQQQNPNGTNRGAAGANAPGFGPAGAANPGFNQPNMPQPGFNQPNMPQPGSNQQNMPFGFGSPQPQPRPPVRNPG